MKNRFEIPARPTEWLTDQTGKLSADFIQDKRAILEGWYQRTGHRFVVWVAPTAGQTPHQYYCPLVFNAWAVGNPAQNDGVVLFIFADDDMRWITVGYGLEHALSDARAARICREEIKPLWNAGKYEQAVAVGIASVIHAIDGADHRD